MDLNLRERTVVILGPLTSTVQNLVMSITQQGADVLGVGLVGAGGEVDQVAEQHRDQAPLLGRGRGGAGEGRPAGPAEPEAPRVVLSANCAPRHGGSLRGRHPPWRPRGREGR